MNVVTPSLRFIGFQGRWHEANLEGISIKNISYGIVQTGEYIDDGVPCIRVVDLTKAKINKKTLIKASDEISNSYRKTILEEGELMIALRGEIGLTQLVFEELVGCNLTRGVARVSPNKNLYDTRFLCAFLNSAKVRQEFDRRKNGSALKEIPISELKKFPVLFPELKEQQKIADFLTSVDTKISQLTEKHRLLKDYKKGVIQQIFSQQIRFKDDDGNVLPEWSYKKLSKITSKVGSGSTPRGGQEAYTSNGVIFIRSQNVYDNKLDLRKIVFIPQSTHTKMKGSKVQKHDVLLNITGASIGRSCVVPKKFEEGNVNQHVCIIRTNTELDPYYLQFFLSSYLGQKIIFQSQAGGGREGLNFESIKLFKIPLPSVKEQQKIAQFLQSLDKKIDAVNDQIKQTKLFKKGLLQQMFV